MTHSIKTQGHTEYIRGMTYVELIVVLSIFSIMSSIVLFNYNDFQAQVDIKNLANDIALKVVEAQKSAIAGALPSRTVLPTWKPSYGIYIDLADNKNFVYYVDLDNNKYYGPSPSESLNKINITRGNYISGIEVFYQNGNSSTIIFTNLSLNFSRPDSGIVFYSNGLLLNSINYVQISISSPGLIKSNITAYASGRIQIK